MMTVIESNIVVIVIALLVGLVIGYWIFRRARSGDTVERHDAVEASDVAPAPIVEAKPARADGREGNSLIDQGAAATTDVAGQVLGVQVHGELPGASGPPDNLELLKGVGPKLAAKLNENGIIRFDQLARLSPNEVAIIEDKLGPFKGRLTRDRIVEQANYLARDDRDGFEAKFGKLGGA